MIAGNIFADSGNAADGGEAINVKAGCKLDVANIMKQFQYTIKDELGVHARPAGLLVKLAKQYTSAITIEKNGKTCDMM